MSESTNLYMDGRSISSFILNTSQQPSISVAINELSHSLSLFLLALISFNFQLLSLDSRVPPWRMLTLSLTTTPFTITAAFTNNDSILHQTDFPSKLRNRSLTTPSRSLSLRRSVLSLSLHLRSFCWCQLRRSC